VNVDEALEMAETWTALPDANGAAHTLAAEVRRLHTWDGLMSLLDEHYPSDVMTGESGDPGPRILRLTREVHLLKLVVDQLRAMRDRAERVRDMADAHPGYGKGRGQAAREILGESTTDGGA
jgi:hypothetical protein